MPNGSKTIYEFMSELSVGGIAETVDALTLTTTGLEGKLSIKLVIDSLYDALILEEKKPFNFRGAKGWSRGSVSYAEQLRDGLKIWCILMVKGELSSKAFETAQKLDDLKVTRIDVAVDVMLLETVKKLPRKIKDTYHGIFDVQLIESATGDTLYCGSRESGTYIRIYDKSDEYGLELGRVWRFEVEFKQDKAAVVAALIRDQGIEIAQDIVWTALKSRNIPSPKIGQTVNLKARKVTLSTPDMKLAWLGRQVKPTVEYLRSIGKEKEVYEQLGFDLPDELDNKDE